MNRLIQAWFEFWFTPSSAGRLVPIRIGLCSVVAIWFASFWPEVRIWFGENGLLATDMAAKLVVFEELARWEYWSPLWWTDSQLVYYLWIVGGMGLAAMVGLGVGGRLSVLVLVAWIISWAHRIVWLTGIVEPALVAFTAYFLVEPGPNVLASWRKAEQHANPKWQARATLRLIQTHWWILLAASLLSQLAGIVWWRGEAVWWLASAERSASFSVETFRNSPLLVNGLTHAFIAIEMLALWLLLTPSGRRLGLAFGGLACLGMALVADQMLYGLLLAIGLLAFATWPRHSTQP